MGPWTQRGVRVFDLAERRQLNRGFNDGFTRAVEVIAAPALLGFLGAAIDGWAGTRPAFTIVLGIFGVCGIFAKLWLGYDRAMRVEEARIPGAGTPAGAGAAAAARPPAVAEAGVPGAGTPAGDRAAARPQAVEEAR